MKIIGILAKKLNHSLSPDIHNYWSKKTRSNFSYRKFELSKHKLNNFFSNFRRNNKFKGFNITIPHKEQCLDLCDKVSSRARKIGAVNLIFKKNKLIYGDNTDVIGFSKCFYSLKLAKVKTVLVIGAGGAARSILYFLNKKKIKNIDVFAPSLKRKKGIVENFLIKSFTNKSLTLKSRYDLIINASSAGMIGKKKLNKKILKIASKSKGIIDIVYNPAMTELLMTANIYKIKNIGGLKMLIEQAKPSYEKWSNKKITVDSGLYDLIKSKL